MTASNSTPAEPAAKEVLPYTHGLTGVDVPLDDSLTNILWLSIGALCLVILCVRFGQMGNAHLRHLLNLNASALQQSYWSEDRTSIWPKLKNNLLYAPLWRKRHNREFQLSRAMNVGTLPSRLHTLILSVYLISNIIYCMYLDYRDPKPKIMAELRGRTGHLSIVNMLPLIVLAGRNSPFIPLLRVSFDTYNLFHRWIGRVVALEALVHTLAWATNEYDAKGMKGISNSLHTVPLLSYGLLGTVALAAIMVQAPSIIRHAFYETFLHIHQFLAMMTIVGVKVHCKLGKLPGEGYIDWVIAIWVLERAARLFRILYRNVSPRRLTKVTVEALEGPGIEACRVSIDLVRPWRYTPGCHLYIYLPVISFWMNHPFSIAWSDTRPTIDTTAADEKFPQRKSSCVDLGAHTTTTLSLIIAKRTGMTAKLFEKARASATGTLTTYGMVEGPYGGLDSLHSYGTVILFAAGVGITHQIGHVRELLEGHAAGTVATQRVVLVWSVKNTETLEWVRPWMDEILQMPNRKQVLKVLLFVTKPRSAREVVSRSETVQMFPGRCNPNIVLGREMIGRVGAVSVTVCGPGAFADEVRGAVRVVVDEGKTVDFMEESFTW
ncbi:hypothetical protein ABVK25_009684 [Lepraria finkii]|uniref:FAD-binding FR-type domain-containing protein n=1 Tax=Lepraria finkii TaxID=1340010 RepID=A0ABR4AZM1_9LECA